MWWTHLKTHFAHTQLGRQLSMDRDLRTAVSLFSVSLSFSFSIATLSHLGHPLFWLSLPISLAVTIYKARQYQFNILISLQAAVLGLIAGTSFVFMIHSKYQSVAIFCRYTSIFALFHFTEFLFTAITNRRSLKVDSFLLNHSIAYWMAAIASWTEFGIEAHFVPQMKNSWISWIGFALCLIGECIRKLAMVHAGQGFTHQVAQSKRSDHRLVTHGVYALCRHPGYSGWFLWSISTQIILCNPVCALVYAYASWMFFSERIYDEEKNLNDFFGDEYVEYQKKVWSGVPFVPGYILFDD